ncbi:MAG: hypothetical protein U0359_04805 [Byssovorax sp.]
MSSLRWFALGFMSLLLGGCAPGPGEPCLADDDCGMGLQCLGSAPVEASIPVPLYAGGGSIPICGAPEEGTCTLPCESDAQCAVMGPGYVCVEGDACGSRFCARP